MLENLGHLGEFLGGLAILIPLVYISLQLREAERQRRAEAMQNRINLRIRIWQQELEYDALHAAWDKFYEEELYKQDSDFHEIEQLTLRERRALIKNMELELLYFQLLFYQREKGIIGDEESGPLNYIMTMRPAPHRRHWKDVHRLIDHFPRDFVSHVDTIVQRFDEVERIMDNDQDADFQTVFLEVFNVPAPPPWLGAAGAARLV